MKSVKFIRKSFQETVTSMTITFGYFNGHNIQVLTNFGNDKGMLPNLLHKISKIFVGEFFPVITQKSITRTFFRLESVKRRTMVVHPEHKQTKNKCL